MKTALLTLAMVLMGQMASAAMIECHDNKTNERILFIADDLGSISTGGVTINKKDIVFPEELPSYTYYYGEYLSLKYTTENSEVVEVVAVRLPDSDDKFIGFLNYSSLVDQQTFYATQITCVE